VRTRFELKLDEERLRFEREERIGQLKMMEEQHQASMMMQSQMMTILSNMLQNLNENNKKINQIHYTFIPLITSNTLKLFTQL